LQLRIMLWGISQQLLTPFNLLYIVVRWPKAIFPSCRQSEQWGKSMVLMIKQGKILLSRVTSFLIALKSSIFLFNSAFDIGVYNLRLVLHVVLSFSTSIRFCVGISIKSDKHCKNPYCYM
jgi:hypothetical protein